MSECKLEQMASFISTKVLSKYSEIEQANMPSIICEEVSTESIKAALDLPELKEVFKALEFYGNEDNWINPDAHVPYWTLWSDGANVGFNEAKNALSKLKSLGIVKEGEK